LAATRFGATSKVASLSRGPLGRKCIFNASEERGEPKRERLVIGNLVLRILLDERKVLATRSQTKLSCKEGRPVLDSGYGWGLLFDRKRKKRRMSANLLRLGKPTRGMVRFEVGCPGRSGVLRLIKVSQGGRGGKRDRRHACAVRQCLEAKSRPCRMR